MKKIFITLFLILLINTSNTFALTTFKDVNQKFWAKPYIDEMVQKGYLKGYEGNVFKPSSNISRIEFIAFLSRAMANNYKNLKDINTDNVFSYYEVNDVKWAINDYNKLMVILNRVNDTKEEFEGMTAIRGTFGDKLNPSKSITRGEVVSLLDNFIDKNKVFINESNLEDIKDHKFKYQILTCETLGLVNGYNDKTFKPDNPITRAEVSKIMKVFLLNHDFIKVIN